MGPSQIQQAAVVSTAPIGVDHGQKLDIMKEVIKEVKQLEAGQGVRLIALGPRVEWGELSVFNALCTASFWVFSLV